MKKFRENFRGSFLVSSKIFRENNALGSYHVKEIGNVVFNSF
jgi:hypothetical protein